MFRALYDQISGIIEVDYWEKTDLKKLIDANPGLVKAHGSELLNKACWHFDSFVTREKDAYDPKGWRKNFDCTRDLMTHLLLAGAVPNEETQFIYINCLRQMASVLAFPAGSRSIWSKVPRDISILESCVPLTQAFIANGLAFSPRQDFTGVSATAREIEDQLCAYITRVTTNPGYDPCRGRA